ncbi:hypothetical protein BD324DRAFT_650066 [Kockovaella imperatae]|uniref:Ras guanine nucleotide exchange factor domain-containing protein n=1 Tax=Kockovaella imperatae TaxID=4999 RepID=A0A1Y1UL00_9TREE|nr:hypothetical protein BD324DRAFT_650066 [Kockovaella imperatae]ORX38721.1 hypothetical protein BD324DRAFT_650066 [Kockovaella imperatae]
MTDAFSRPYSTASIISPHDALEALVAKDRMDMGTYPPSPDELAPPSTSTTPSRPLLSNGQAHPNSSSPLPVNDGMHGTPPTSSRAGPSRLGGSASGIPPQTPPPVENDPFDGRHFVRAIFDFAATDPSALSFCAGDIIEVITRLESGWWDGLLGRERGWFPSNYVQGMDPRSIMDHVDLVVEDDEEEEGEEVQAYSPVDSFGSAQAGPSRQRRSVDRQVSRRSHMSLSTTGDDLALRSWDDVNDDFTSSVGLGDLAREVMGQGEDDDFEAAADHHRRRRLDPSTVETNGPTDEFALAARDRQRRQQMAWEGEGTPKADDFEPGAWGRQRQETTDTVRELQRATMESHTSSEKMQGSSGGGMDAWVPSMTPDGQVYYHNELTGEDAWELPTRLPSEGSETFDGGDDDDDFFSSSFATSGAGPSSAAVYASARLGGGGSFGLDRPPAPSGEIESFQPPPRSRDLPEPWTMRMTDDGRGWYYVDTVTGHTRKNPPSPIMRDTSDHMNRLSIASIPPPQAPARTLQPRRSLDLRRRQMDDWARQTRERVRARIPRHTPPTMAQMIENVNESLRDVFEACVAGSSAEEEVSRADDLGSESDVVMALAREEAAEASLKIAHLSTLAAIRDLFAAFGYVGPLEADADMPRPKWVGDMTLIGSIGLLSANVHAATTSHRLSDSGTTTWHEVMRSASKLNDVIALFPASVSPGTTAAAQDAVKGKIREITLSTDGFGWPFSGRFGFGKVKEGKVLRALNGATVEELDKVRLALSDSIGRGDPVIDHVRLMSTFLTLLLSVDVASSIDTDGDASVGAEEANAKAYSELVRRARIALGDLESVEDRLHRFIASALTSTSSPPDLTALATVTEATMATVRSLLDISSIQRSMIDQSLVLGQFGHRSPSYVRPELSPPSRLGKLTIPKRTARGLEEEFLDAGGEFNEELRDQAGELVPSASGSQVSLPRRAVPQPGPGEISATSSTTSLTYQKSDSDTASQKGKRSSLMRFMRGRSGSDADEGRLNAKSRQTSKKLAKLLGEDVSTLGHPLPPPLAPPIQQVPETPWYLGNDYEASELMFDDKGGVRAGSLRALVARLTPYGSTDTSFFQAFMLTFRSFTSSQELLDSLLQRYYIEPPAGLTSVELSDWTRQKQTPLRLRVCNTLRAWLDKYYVDKLDSPLLDRIEQFAEDETRMLAAQQLKGLVQRRRRGEIEVQRRIVSGALLSPPAPLIPRVPAGREMNVLDVAPLELARQLTILESGFFQRVQPAECLNKSWNGPDGDKHAPNVRGVIKTANILSGWVGTTCLSSRDAKHRARIMKHFVQTAIELRNLNNFSSMAAVAAGLNTAPVLRLKRSWELCSPKTQAQKAEVDKTLDSTKNFSNYKDMLKTINPPCVPFFGFWLSALTFIEDGNKDFIPAATGEPVQPGSGMSHSTSSSSLNTSARTPVSAPTPLSAFTPSTSTSTTTASTAAADGNQPLLINFFKRSLAAEILRDIQQYQSQPYNLAKSRMVYDWLMKQLEYCDRTYDLDKMYNLSLQLEPREREEERITRMLHDSGFI